ncbi:MAG TPA: UDP-N-acetylmuramoyl-tripeptide--D-alanyl-D-alanine ligase [Candidatus Paceibacterota bacterium]|nr:UDP-N-acetylmuramoyl-tripeptide--D-alanyl-D-alanine ligase [Candidatus Paceibacterota bacterium]
MQPLLKQAVVAILTWEAQLVLKRHQPKIIAITGSAGKTTTKDAIFTVLSEGRHVRKSEKSYNSELGVPLAILGLESGWGSPWRWLVNIVKGALVAMLPHDYPDWLVLEVGADRPGDIRRIAKWLRPDIAVITSIPDIPVHVEFFSSPQALAREKKYLAEYLKFDGILVINGDDVHTKRIMQEFQSVAVSFGFEGQNAFVATDAGIQYENKRPVGMHFYSNHSGTKLSVSLFGALGTPRVYAALAALAVAEAAGVPQEAAADALRYWVPPPGRLRIIEGLKESLIIDDTYNSSPAAATAALDTLKEIKGFKKKIAVLGDMLELGRYSKDAHIAIGKKAAKVVDQLVTVGLRARAIAESARDGGLAEADIRQYEQGEAARAGKELENEIDKNTIILVKGSQSMRLEKTVEEIMAEPLRAAELLVRQDSDWKER